jgi:hypothetical protein
LETVEFDLAVIANLAPVWAEISAVIVVGQTGNLLAALHPTRNGVQRTRKQMSLNGWNGGRTIKETKKLGPLISMKESPTFPAFDTQNKNRPKINTNFLCLPLNYRMASHPIRSAFFER